jgi:hypothetical protein
MARQTRDAVENLLHYAAELERIALETEMRVCARAETIARTKALGAEIKKLVEETQARLQQGNARAKSKG